MIKKFFIICFVILCFFSVTLASGENLSNEFFELGFVSGEIENNIEENEIKIVKDSKYKDETKTFKGIVVTAGKKYTEKDEWSNMEMPYQDVRVEVEEEGYKNIFEVKYQLSYYNDPNIKADELKVGDKVYVNVMFDEEGIISQTYIEYINNESYLVAMIILYAGAIILIGGTKGVRALVGLILTILAVFYIMIPLIFEGYPPLLVTILTCVGIIVVTFIIISGFSKKTIAASLGTIGGILVAGIFALVFGNFMKLTGVCDHALQLSMIEDGGRFNLEYLMISGIIVGALGACMDVGMSIASSLHELSVEGNGMTIRKLIKSGMNIGKDVMGTMTNTLILAYVGSSMMVILLVKGWGFEAYQIANNAELVLEEVLRALAGSFGLVVTIPITTLISSVLMGRKDDNLFYDEEEND